MIKNIFRKLFQDEFNNFEHEIEILKKQNASLERDVKEQSENISKEKTKLLEVQLEKQELDKRISDLEKENEILRKYYELEKEPSDEIKTKMHIDLEINRLKDENLKLTIMANKAMITPLPYPTYIPYFGKW